MRVILSLLLSVFCFIPSAIIASDAPYLLVLGDSLSAGYGMDREQSWVSLLEIRLQNTGHDFQILNSSISGDTTQGGIARLDRLLNRYQPEFVIIELGGNDGLRGIDIDITRQNLTHMIQQSQARGAEVLIAGIKLPPNYGSAYTDQFESIYADLAREYSVMHVPFFMQNVAFNPELMQADGIHPNVQGQPVLLENVWQVLQPVLDAK